MKYLEDNGTPASQSGQVATNAYTAIRDLREQMMNQNSGRSQSSSSGGGGSSFGGGAILGVVFLVGGIAASAATDRVFYGAMIVGVIMIFKGLMGGND